MTPPAAKSDNILVTVTGASGFIATHCILGLLQAGYRVRGTVRSFKRRKEIEEGPFQARRHRGQTRVHRSGLAR